MRATLTFAGLALLLGGSSVRAESWPRWLGPRNDGISRESGLLARWPEAGPKVLWRAKVGIGYATPVVAGGRVFTFMLDEGREVLTAFDLETGALAWRHGDEGGWERSYEGTRATPFIDGDRIYTLGGAGAVSARELASGKLVWRVNVLEAAGSTDNLTWGASASPLVDGERIYLQAGKGGAVAVALETSTGRVAWTSEAKGVGGYAAPVLVDAAQGRQLVVFGGTALFGLVPADGRTAWELPWKTEYDVNAVTPIHRSGRLFVTSAYNHGGALLRLTPGGPVSVWENRDGASKFPPAILDGDALYLNNEGVLTCLDWETGRTRWRATDRDLRLGSGGSFVRVGDRLVTLSERGVVSLVKATPTGVERLSQATMLKGDRVWSSPVVAEGRLFLKGHDELVVADLRAPKPAAAVPAAP
jgi:outer membrane protein assembly factor BamB